MEAPSRASGVNILNERALIVTFGYLDPIDAATARGLIEKAIVDAVLINWSGTMIGTSQCSLSAQLRKSRCAALSGARGHVWTAPAVQEESDYLIR